ncbi:hypothetical protein VTL71DRAFT_7027 [Oculimacula yallundae]|uniref:Uncharacterized protein n=1 Tax=Oculimacula yallundae TaxID=86028 RepID=A0ABR4BVK6_9HELO
MGFGKERKFLLGSFHSAPSTSMAEAGNGKRNALRLSSIKPEKRKSLCILARKQVWIRLAWLLLILK